MIVSEINNDSRLRTVLAHVRTLAGWLNFNISELKYSGAVIGSVFATYNANVLYISKMVYFDTSHVVPNVNKCVIRLYNEADILHGDMSNNVVLYNGVDILYNGNLMMGEYVLFSRIFRVNYTLMDFTGYRLERI